MPISPVQNTTAMWAKRKEEGSDITWQPVERHFGKGSQARKYDLFGFGDYIYVEDGNIVLVQICGPGEHPAHKRKILAEPRARQWIEAGGYIELISWSMKLIKKGQKPKHWVPRIEEITLDMFYAEDKMALRKALRQVLEVVGWADVAWPAGSTKDALEVLNDARKVLEDTK